MKPLFECELEFVPNFHLMQLYTGLYALNRKGVIDLKVKFRKSNRDTLPITTVLINGKKVFYDCLDGLSWKTGTREDNLKYFQETYKGADFYFKRSYHKSMQQYRPAGCIVLPYGLNYNVEPSEFLLSFNNNIRDKFEYVLKSNRLTSNVFKKRFYYQEDFEYYPVNPAKDKVLFITRLWNPEDAKSPNSKIFRQQLNEVRIQCIEACKKEYGVNFTGGVFKESYASKNYPSLVMPDHLTNKRGFLQQVKEHSICITTTGLHRSIGWKLAEYVAASRAIVTEPLEFEVTGNFSAGNNYLEFTTADELIQNTELLLSNRTMKLDMMYNNFYYYNNFLKPENLVLNTLLKVDSTIGNALQPTDSLTGEFVV